jgi:monoamine oxidase
MESVDVVVVGAGFAGLTAAVDLVAKGHRVVVLEARNRVAGRTAGKAMSDGINVEIGGQWVGPTQDAVLELAARYDVKTYPGYVEGGDRLSVFGGVLRRGDFASRGLPEAVLAEIGRLKADLEAMAATVDLDAPWATERAAQWDAMTLHSWLATATQDAEAREFYAYVAPAIFAAEAAEMSLLHFLFYVASGQMFDILLGFEGGAQESRLVGGSHLICEAMAAELGPDVVRLSSPVRAISQHAEGAVVSFDGGRIAARRVIVTLPPALAGRLHYSPPLPGMRDQLTQQVPMGSVIKTHVVYQRRFWQDAGLSGTVSSPQDPVSVVADNTPYGSERGVLVAFCEAAQARKMSQLSPQERQQVVIGCLVEFFGPEAADFVEYIEQDWSAEEYSRGCYGGRFGAGVWTAYGRLLREPVGVIHWAGTETASVWNGYMDGAVRSGHRAADEVAAALAG